ncbi:hypothetical protein [Halorussus caseinilyticus]|uniref:DUF2798 domain-containing protein n=1 Tax=Halorussus caseinilyticus TaxID=3034025 RepID=A0ABD5WUG8_9EURY|nr:hypothetical protein [Halorussus sp. DT72]
MKLNTQLRRAGPAARTRRGRIASKLTRFTLPVATLLALVASALLTGAAFATVADLVPTTIPTLLAGWVAAVGVTFALPLLAVRSVVALLERVEQ